MLINSSKFTHVHSILSFDFSSLLGSLLHHSIDPALLLQGAKRNISFFPSYCQLFLSSLTFFPLTLHLLDRQGKFTGQPVIFVPGNAGSYEQVRSLASVAHRMFEDGLKDVRLDFFTLHLNEEKSGLFGQVLTTQVHFLAHCITRIQQLYASNGEKNVSCILIGHSIGGIVARALMLEPWFDASCVQLLITLAAPHRRPSKYHVLRISCSSFHFFLLSFCLFFFFLIETSLILSVSFALLRREEITSVLYSENVLLFLPMSPLHVFLLLLHHQPFSHYSQRHMHMVPEASVVTFFSLVTLFSFTRLTNARHPLQFYAIF